jgi:hypothetical protein
VNSLYREEGREKKGRGAGKVLRERYVSSLYKYLKQKTQVYCKSNYHST